MNRSTIGNHDDVLIVGAGVIGLSLAYELSSAGVQVRLLERQAVGREASWAGAGILPPAQRTAAAHPYDQLRGLACELHPIWSAQLREETGIHNDYHRGGGLYLARSTGEAAALQGMIGMWRDEGIAVESLRPEQLIEREPALAALAGAARKLVLLSEEAQLRNPRHLKALRAALHRRGVTMEQDNPVRELIREGSRIVAADTSRGRRFAGQFCITSGAWSVHVLQRLGIATGILPIRGQMILFKLPARPFMPVINEGPRYLVPRTDGFVLAGSTEEEAGFDKRTTQPALEELGQFAASILPDLSAERRVTAWAGLRPGSFDGFPYLGALPDTENGFLAAGHFRSGLFLAPATARVMAQTMLGQTPEISLEPFNVVRGRSASTA